MSVYCLIETIRDRGDGQARVVTLSNRQTKSSVLRALAVDDDNLRKLLKERKRRKGYADRMPYRKKVGVSKIRTIVKTPSGETVYSEEKEVKINPYTAENEETTTYVSDKCGCGRPVTGEMLALDLIKPCFVCRRITCQSCRANTNQTEYLKPQVRGQPVCTSCWTSPAILREMMIRCPSCDQPVKDYYDIKTCGGWCRDKICPSCGIQTHTGGLVCNACYPKYAALKEELRI